MKPRPPEKLMAKCKCKSEPCPEGVPAWIVTYGDMMTLLLCFFILLAAFSELKKDEEYSIMAQSVMEAFGFQDGSGGKIPLDAPSLQSVIMAIEKANMGHEKKTEVSQSDVEGAQGKNTQVKTVRDGLIFTLGGSSTFDRESARLNDATKEELRAIAKLIGGRKNRIDIRGHCDAKRLSPGSRYKNLYELSYARAQAIMLFLTEELGLHKELFRLEACADSEPIHPRAGSDLTQQINRRVEIILSESLIDDFHPDANYTDPANARGG